MADRRRTRSWKPVMRSSGMMPQPAQPFRGKSRSRHVIGRGPGLGAQRRRYARRLDCQQGCLGWVRTGRYALPRAIRTGQFAHRNALLRNCAGSGVSIVAGQHLRYLPRFLLIGIIALAINQHRSHRRTQVTLRDPMLAMQYDARTVRDATGPPGTVRRAILRRAAARRHLKCP